MTNENARKEVASENKEFLEAFSYLVDFLEVKRYVLACVARHGYLAKRYNSENYFGMYDVLCLRSEKGDTKSMFDKIWANLEEEYGSHMRKIDSDMSVPEMLSDTTKAYSWSRERKKVPNLEEVRNTCDDFWNRMKVFEDDIC